MNVTRLKLNNLRAIETAEFRFLPGMNLIVGVNGVGKTSMLDSLRVCLSAVVNHANGRRGQPESFAVEDIRVGAAALTVDCGVRLGHRQYSYLVHKPREASVPRKKKAGVPREDVYDTPEKSEFVGEAPSRVGGDGAAGRPLAVLFSTNRAVPSERAPGKAVTGGGITGALADAFADRELRLGEFAAWMRARESLRRERPAAVRVLADCREAVERFLPGYCNLRPEGEGRPRLWIDCGETPIPVRQLSDGERGVLALVLDLTRRLAQANPELDAPTLKAEAVVLIDEIDLHLHPRWQRQIVHNLTFAFPRCQFIATTHSPQVIGEVDPERIQIIAHGQVYPPTHSFGVDSSRVLEEIMETDPRAKAVHELLGEISQVLGQERFDRGRDLLGKLVEQLGEADPEVTRLQTLLDFVEGRE